MKVVLVNPPSPPEFRVSRGLMGGFGMAVNSQLLYPPIELAHVAAVLEQAGHEVLIHDSDALGLDSEGARQAILALAEVGSSNKIRSGSQANAVASTTRCFSPPETSCA